MGDDGKVAAAAELIYAPAPSWVPALTGFGIALVIVGLFTAWAWSLIGAIFLLASLIRWFSDSEDEISRMPVEQRPVTAVLPPKQVGD
jgi:hypothetical protein